MTGAAPDLTVELYRMRDAACESLGISYAQTMVALGQTITGATDGCDAEMLGRCFDIMTRIDGTAKCYMAAAWVELNEPSEDVGALIAAKAEDPA